FLRHRSRHPSSPATILCLSSESCPPPGAVAVVRAANSRPTARLPVTLRLRSSHLGEGVRFPLGTPLLGPAFIRCAARHHLINGLGMPQLFRPQPLQPLDVGQALRDQPLLMADRLVQPADESVEIPQPKPVHAVAAAVHALLLILGAELLQLPEPLLLLAQPLLSGGQLARGSIGLVVGQLLDGLQAFETAHRSLSTDNYCCDPVKVISASTAASKLQASATSCCRNCRSRG